MYAYVIHIDIHIYKHMKIQDHWLTRRELLYNMCPTHSPNCIFEALITNVNA